MRPSRFLSLCLLLVTLSTVTLPAQVSATIVASRDNTLYESQSGNRSNGAGTRMFAGLTDNDTRRRALIAFDVAGNIPACSTITSVTLQLQMVMTQAGGVPIGAHRVLADWGEGASVAGGGQGGGANTQTGDTTWIHTFSPSGFWSTPGGEFVSTASSTISVSGNGSYLWPSNPQMVADVQTWLDAPASSFGWLLLGPENPGNATAKAFATREDGNTSFRPTLTVTYTPPATAGVTVTGTGCVGSSGQPFSLSANGLPVIGGAGFSLTASGGPSSSVAQLFLASGIGAAPVPVGASCLIHLDVTSALQLISFGISPITLPLDANGGLFLPLPLNPDCGLAGQSLSIQLVAFDTIGPIATEALTLDFGI